MEKGALTSYLDVAQVVLYFFWAFLAMLIIYLRREDKREGYPLESDTSALVTVNSYPGVPSPKRFLLPDGTTAFAPRADYGADRRPIKATPVAGWPGAPLHPDGDPMEDGVGPASYAERSDTPDLTVHGTPKLVPLRSLDDFFVPDRDPDPRGMDVVGADGVVGGVVRDLWIDRAEYIIRYLEVETGDATMRRSVLIPATLARVGVKTGRVSVNSVLGEQITRAPMHKRPDVVTRLEEDRISAYYASGNLYAHPGRTEALL